MSILAGYQHGAEKIFYVKGGRAGASDFPRTLTGWSKLYKDYLGAEYTGKTEWIEDPNVEPAGWMVKNISALLTKFNNQELIGPGELGIRDWAAVVAKDTSIYESSNMSSFAQEIARDALKFQRSGDPARVVGTFNEAERARELEVGDAFREDQDTAHADWSSDENAAGSINLEQQFLIRNVDGFALRNSDNIAKQQYKNLVNILGDPQDTITKFLAKPGMAPLLNIAPHQRAAIVPKIRLYKVYRPKPGRPDLVKEKEFIFKNFTEVNKVAPGSITKGEFGRGTGVGITKLGLDFEGTNLAAAKKELRVQLELHFQNFKSLATDKHLAQLKKGNPMTTSDDDPTYLDLVWRQHRKKKDKSGQEFYNPKHFEIKLVVGWSAPRSSALFTSELRSAIKNMTTAIYLSQIDHTFSFNQDGSIDLSIEFRGRIDETLSGPRADILYDQTLKRKTASHKEKITKIRKQLGDSSLTDDKRKKLEKQLKDAEKKKNGVILSSKKEKYINIINRLMRHDSLYFTDVRFGDMVHVVRTSNLSVHKAPEGAADGTQATNAHRLMQSIEAATADDYDARLGALTGARVKEQRKNGNTLWYKQDGYTKSCNSYRLHYFYFGDLMDILVDIIQGNHPGEFNDINYILTSFLFKDAVAGKQLIPLASIPISLNYFCNWMVEHVISEQRPMYMFMNFLRDFIEGALIKSFASIIERQNVENKNYSVQFGYKVVALPPNTLKKVYASPSSGPPTGADVDATGRWHPDTPVDQAGLRRLLWGRPDTKRSVTARKAETPVINKTPQHCVIIYPYTSDLSHLVGNYAADVENGIYHLGLGLNKGIVNEIQFNKSEIPIQREKEFLTSTEESFGQVKRIYNATVRTMGNSLFYPGSTIFLNPSIPGLASPSSGAGKPLSILAQMGLGGYYTVQKVHYELTPHDFETVLECIWAASGRGDQRAKPETRSLSGRAR